MIVSLGMIKEPNAFVFQSPLYFLPSSILGYIGHFFILLLFVLNKKGLGNLRQVYILITSSFIWLVSYIF